MNIICDTKHVIGVWLVDTRAPNGTRMLINHKGTVEEAIEKARWAEPDPA